MSTRTFFSFNDRTERMRRNLLILSTILIAVTLKPIKVKSAFGVDIENVLTAGEIRLALTVFILYNILSFGWNAWDELMFWKHSGMDRDMVTFGGGTASFSVVEQIDKALKEAKNALDKMERNDDLPKRIKDSLSALERVDSIHRAYSGGLQAVSWSSFARVTLLEFSLPILYAGASISFGMFKDAIIGG